VEQQRIAEILNTVDETIRNTELLIAKLKQVKQGLLQDLLTRGIGDNIGLRAPTPQSEPVGNGAIGRIATSWKVVPLAGVLDGIEAGKSPDCPDRPAASGEWGVLKVSAIKAEGFDQRENKVLPNRSLVDPRFEVQHGDLLISRANTYELVGLACLVEGHPDRLLLCDKTLRLRTVASVNRKFVLHALETVHARRQIQVHATGTSGSMKNISQAAIAGVLIPLPPRDEQDRIVSILAAVGSRVDAERAWREKLRLLKIGLMEDLLTGRVRVTEVLQGAAT
jgi:type I restriction enzyme S subunit